MPRNRAPQGGQQKAARRTNMTDWLQRSIAIRAQKLTVRESAYAAGAYRTSGFAVQPGRLSTPHQDRRDMAAVLLFACALQAFHTAPSVSIGLRPHRRGI